MSSLSGKEVLITRARHQADTLKERLESRGAGVTAVPLLSFAKRDSEENVRLLENLDAYDWVLITSTNGVWFFNELIRKYLESTPEGLKYAAVGPKTKLALEEEGRTVSFLPSSYSAEFLVKEWVPMLESDERVLYVRGNLSRETVREGLKEHHISFDSMTAYDTLILEEKAAELQDRLRNESWDALTFFSPSAVEAFCELSGTLCNRALDLPCFCIGPTTERQAADAGFTNIQSPATFTAEALIEKMEKYFNEKG
ncbi:uroporphyrinogen-III synthase [Salimicrobium salexigens]|uniref:Uroporphyrinogen-III synthase n=1 Tax=Salimicrobium salexigens TaxID=908941 RepID=A0ABY1KMR0_9BACI|nr:uroporphyrinogen-III synthase [Salimicrobium salexigens]SIS50710.1 uroporphyrinogen-III synthase [Salimicrobium salexigens]